MNLRRFSRSLLYMVVATLCAVLPASCSETSGDSPDNPGFEEGVPSEVSFTLSSRSGNYTRADGIPKDPTASVEKIHDWWIALVDRNGNVTVKTRGEASAAGFEAETFKCILPTGTYDIYAFANIPVKTETEFLTLLVAEGGLASTGLSKVISGFVSDGMQWPSDKYIPMTGHMQVKVRNTVEEVFAIEVIRAVAKVEFSIENPTEDAIKLRNLSFDRVTKSDISLLPDYAAIGVNAYKPFGSADYGTLTLDGYLGSDVLEKNKPHKFSYYCKESLAEESFKISLTVERKSGTAEAKEVTQDFYTKKLKNYINRNDWIYIPISFSELVVSDWEVYWKLYAYPPIGGYPPVYEQNADGSKLEATMTYGGEFELYPASISKDGKIADYNGEIDWNSVTLSVNSGSDLFVSGPKLEDNPSMPGTKMIVGDLNPKKEGDAVVEIKFKFKEGPDVSTVFTSLFTIHRKNPAKT